MSKETKHYEDNTLVPASPEKVFNDSSRLKVFIDYELPKLPHTRWLGYLFGGIYAKWCVNQMIKGVNEHFTN